MREKTGGVREDSLKSSLSDVRRRAKSALEAQTVSKETAELTLATPRAVDLVVRAHDCERGKNNDASGEEEAKQD